MARGNLRRFYEHVRDWWTREQQADELTTGTPPIDPAYNGLYAVDATSPDAADAVEDVRTPDEPSDDTR